nr:spermatogenesis-associated serine-rich protein 1 [Mastacembelus armatus]
MLRLDDTEASSCQSSSCKACEKAETASASSIQLPATAGFNTMTAVKVNQNIQAAETFHMRDSSLQTTEVVKTVRKRSHFPCNAVIGSRPYCSPEYSPGFYKLGSKLPQSTFLVQSHIIPIQPSSKTRVSYVDKRRIDAEIEEVKQLDEWKPVISIFTAVLEALDDKHS